MFRIVQTVWIDRCRAERTRPAAAPLEDIGEIAGDDGESLAHGRLELARVRRLIAALPDDQRAVLALVSVEGCSYREAADILDIPIGTVMSRLARARRALASGLDAAPAD
jgi:RNA polymerase sigma-70 factor (ECF subfamily)